LEQNKQPNNSLPLWALANPGTLGYVVATKAVGHIIQTAEINKDFIGDFAKFNFCGIPTSKEIVKRSPIDKPRRVREKLLKYYTKYFRGKSMKDIAKKLNIRMKQLVRVNVLECKWEYEYRRAYGNEYHSRNVVTSRMLLRPLTGTEPDEFDRLF